ncbi:hypothetical protein H6784_05825 [Candidatus Nomurabacteria bacterium]|nr:hypothetical protein [Candidatus Nomurabacteria bacterium]
MDPVTILGVIGAGIILLAFLMNQKDKWLNDSLVYDVTNAVGALMLVIYAYLISSYPFMVLNTVWFLSAFLDIVKYYRNKN